MKLPALILREMLFGGLFGGGDKQKIGKMGALKPYKGYCQAEYKFFPKRENYNLEKLFVVFRHGERVPLHKVDGEWKSAKCRSCSLSKGAVDQCKKVSCSNGLLTSKGSSQAKSLGKFIKKNYEKLLFDKKISINEVKLRSTNTSRTLASLAGVMKGLVGEEKAANVDVGSSKDSLRKSLSDALTESNEDLLDFFNKPMISRDSERFKKYCGPEGRLDHYLCAMCTNTKINCKELNCDEPTIAEHLKSGMEGWSYLIHLASQNDEAKKRAFGDFAKDLLCDLGGDALLSLYAAHDTSLAAILAGLDTGIGEWPPFASALFIEIWCHGGKQTVRLVFNNRVIKPSTAIDDFVPIKDFIDILSDKADVKRKDE
jgi:2-phosphoxylose phosphatase